MVNWDMSNVGLRCPDCMHPQHSGLCGRVLRINSLASGTCHCSGTVGRDFKDEMSQKSEGCWCGAHIDVEGTEESVLAACTNFRAGHRHKQPVSKEQQIQDLMDDLMRHIPEQFQSIDLWSGQIRGFAKALSVLRGTTIESETTASRKRVGRNA